MSAEGTIVWQPSPAAVDRALVTDFRHAVNARHGLELADHEALWRWSVAERGAFWSLLWGWCGVVGEGPGEPAVIDPGAMPGARWFPAARLNYAENLLQGPDTDEALVFRGEDGESRRLARGELRRDVAAVAGALAADGVGPGDRVAGYLPNLPETVVAMLAATSLGAVWSSCSPDFGPAGVLDRFGQIEPTVLFVADGHRYGGRDHDAAPTIRRLQDELPGLRRTVVVPHLASSPALADGQTAWADYRDPAAPPRFHRGSFDAPLFIMFSSGTTGPPKCMVHTVGGTLLQHLKEHRLHGDLRPGDRFFYHTTCGWMMWNWLVSGLASGATVLLYDGHPLRPATVLWDFVADEGVATFGTSARHLAACRKEGLRPGDSHDLGPLRAVLSTGSPLDPETFDWVYEAVKTDVRLSSISGGTDIISCFALGSPVLPVRRGELQCRGLGMDVAVFDEAGAAVTGAKGELVCRSAFPSQPSGFWNDPDGARYRAAYFEGHRGVWAHGDYAELTPSGGMVIHGRSDAVLNPGGVRIGTAEIYRVVDAHPDLLESVVVGQEHRGDVRVVLCVVLVAGRTLTADLEDDLRARIRRDTSPRHVPAIVRQVPAVPRTVSGKIVELAVRDILHGRPVANADVLANPESLAPLRRLAVELAE